MLPPGIVLDFALIDVERMEIECLEGLSNTIARSPNFILYVEWSGVSFNTKDLTSKKEKLLDWFIQKNYKFYVFESTKGTSNCELDKVIELSREAVLNIGANNGPIDILFIPAHLDPQTGK